ncbi:MAG: DUF116 domain-containing protein [candidate division KSB1 bacterium]|nr:DUF116 domain-containing protein [candidate division KSB1 bacterium]MDZ7385730.1 DUF116 domain-containing protein [candidate division KSB1 bacterium]MDZ7392118.1 DUF116 domain-containing protein [candidate division KSB1 bacterium]MDZ7414320.1 DUF116 domain-containing protein [candidate division KSB1 bacterium]
MAVRKTDSLAKFEIRDRNLGDEWLVPDWSMEEASREIHVGRRLFLGFALLALLCLGAATWFTWYLIAPRLSSFHPILPYAVGIVVLVGGAISLAWFGLTVVSIVFEKNFLLLLFGREFSLSFLTPLVLRLGRRFGISRDEMSHSFIRVSNSLIRATRRTVQCERLLILLPRCLQRPLKEKVEDLARKYECQVYVASGGEAARRVVAATRPTAIIGIACERDLLSGLQDNVTKIPIIAIPNRRPEGPCKNTLVDFEEVERAVQFFRGIPAAH